MQPKLLDVPTVAKMKTDEIFTNLVMQHGRKPVKDGNAERGAHLKRYGEVSSIRVKHCQELFTCTTDEKETPKSILVTGKAGIGKTLFCQKLFRDWATEKLLLPPTDAQLPTFKFAYLLTFRQLNLLEGETLTLQELLNCSVILDDQSNISDEVFEYILNHPKEVLIILDGFDEFSQHAKIVGDEHERYPNSCRNEMPIAALCAKLMRGKILGKATILITSRPDETDKIIGMGFDRNVEITGFSQQEVREYIEKYFRHDEIMKNTVLDHITKNENLISFAHIPVLCALMCSYMEYVLQESKSTEDLPISASDLYFEVFNIFRGKHDKNEVSHFDEAFLVKLSKFAAELLLEKKFLFSEEELTKKFNSEEVESLRKSGILHCGPPFRVSFSQTTKHFCFTHLTLHEYLAALWFVKRREIPPEQTVSTMVMQFMAGILSKEKDSELMEKLLEQLSPNTCIEPNQHLLPGKCLYEYQDKEFAKDYYREHPVRGGNWICFSGITDVDCIAISFFLDILSALNEEEPSKRQQTSSSEEPPFISVERLGIANSEMTLSEQCSISTIKELIIEYSMISSGLTRISASLEKDFCLITELFLPYCQLNHECPDCIRRLLSKKLSSLVLWGNFFTDAGVASLCEALKEPSCKVTKLGLNGNQTTDAGVVSLCEALKELSCKVTKLGLNGNQITDAGVASLCEALKEPSCKVTKLGLNGNQITDAGVASLCEALKEPSCKLTKLGLNGNQITDAGVISLCEALKEPSWKVITLSLDSNQITDAGVVSLCEALKEPSCKVTTLSLDSNQITDAGVVSLCEALKDPSCKVTTLSLDSNQITDAGVVSLCEALKDPSCKVTTLDLGSNCITDAGAVSLCEALKEPSCKVTTLSLDCNQIADAGVVSLCEALKEPSCKVTTLGLAYNQITDAGVVSLWEALKLPSCKVTTLDLATNHITDAGVVSLCEALKEPSCKVTTLSLDRNQITDVGAVSLCEALKQPSCKVTKLRLDRNQVTDAGAASLREALKQPSCKVTKLSLDYNQITDVGAASQREALKQL